MQLSRKKEPQMKREKELNFIWRKQNKGMNRLDNGLYLFYQKLTQFIQTMTSIKTFNILIIGRSGSGKSATTKLLTSNPAIKVANSLKEVTTDVNFYDGTSFEVNGEFIRFRILDIPGLDKISNRVDIREKILQKLEEHNISLQAIIYVSSLTERDTIDEDKLFSFLEQLPWSNQLKKNALIPIFTKYDNLVIDSQEEDIEATKKEFHDIFQKLQYGAAWGKRIYWINHTKSLDFKIKCYEEIREKYQRQVQRLVIMLKKIKNPLTAKAIRDVIEQEDIFILKRLFSLFQDNAIPNKKQKKSHQVILKIQVEPQKFEDSLTTVSASSIGIFISKVCIKEIPTCFSLILMSVPITIALLKLASQIFVFRQKKSSQTTSGDSIMKSYEHICSEINGEMEREWKQLNSRLQFTVYQKYLHCRVPIINYKFFDVTNMSMSFEQTQFEKTKSEAFVDFMFQIPKFQDQIVWTPQILIQYEIKKFDEESILKQIQAFRKQFYSGI